MPAFLVHGVPDTHRLWDPVRAHLTRADIIAPDMPGFARDIPAGFGCTKEEYADWLTTQIEKVGEPVDLVGHDWGAILVQRVASLRPDLIRTWASGAAAIDLEYTWHEIARLWQTPTVGEQVMLGMTPDTMKGALTGAGVPAELAAVTAEQVDDRMKDAVLKLYRSATNPGGLAGGAGQRPQASALPLGRRRSVRGPPFRRSPGSTSRWPRRRLRELRPLVAAGAPAGSRGRSRSALGLRLSRPRLLRRSNYAGCALAPSPASWTTPASP